MAKMLPSHLSTKNKKLLTSTSFFSIADEPQNQDSGGFWLELFW